MISDILMTKKRGHFGGAAGNPDYAFYLYVLWIQEWNSVERDSQIYQSRGPNRVRIDYETLELS